MAYSFQPLEQALDSLGFSYIDGVTVKIASEYRVDCDLAQVKEIINKPAPSVLAFDSNYDVSYEKKVLEDIDARALADKNKREERKKRIAEYEKKKQEDIERRKKEAEEKALEDERKRLEEIENEKKARLEAEEKRLEEEAKALEEEAELKKKEEEEIAQRKKREEEAEWQKFDEERIRANSISCDKSEDDSIAAEYTTPPQELRTPEETQNTPEQPTNNVAAAAVVEQPNNSKDIIVKGTQSQELKFTKINFSDFEGTSSDPFADLELKSINDLAELQTILGNNSVTSSVNSVTSVNNVVSQPQYSQNSVTYTTPGKILCTQRLPIINILLFQFPTLQQLVTKVTT